ncbi:hypothetical protein M432DRAFT_256871 [Thermoascus aurantiacus ATCC 26904]
MWLYRGAQSAIWYYASCTPCAECFDRRKRKKEAERSQREKAKAAALVTEQPRPFPQPTPFSTNPGWKEEIALGPGPPARRGRQRTNNRPRGGQQAGGESASLSTESSRSVGDESSQRKDKRLTWMRYQREDEPLWGEEIKGSSVGISGAGRAETSSSSKYYIARVPPVNDLHPPIVSCPTSRAEVRWMLQPPPSARVMAGKERGVSARGSRGASRDGSVRKGDSSRKASRQTPTKEEGAKALGHSTTRDERASRPDDGSPAPSRKKSEKKQRPPPITTSDNPDSSPGHLNLPKRPPLATIASHSHSVTVPHTPPPRDEFCLHASPSMNSRSYSPSTLSSLAESSEASPGLFRCPETPRSRPGSGDSDQAFRPPVPKLLPTLQPFSKDIQSLHVEIDDERDGLNGPDQLRRVRPWRWSMDI